MGHLYPQLKALGWNEWFEQKAECGPSDTIARVAAVDRDRLLLLDHNGSFPAKLAGRYRHRHRLSRERPCVGDWVCVQKAPGDEPGRIGSVLERKTTLRRRSAGDTAEYQMIAANVDCVFIVQSCHFDFNLKRLERYLVMVSDGGAEPCILLTKTDLVEPAVVDAQLGEIQSAGIGAPVLPLSNITREGVHALGSRLSPGKTYCFVGSSGVGKSTLINHLTGRELLETAAVSETGEGKHTTVRRELIRLDGGALVIDTPGMREFGILDAEDGLSDSFSGIVALASRCRYRDCTHTGEPQCAVMAAVEAGDISREHYENYLKLKKESEFHRMSSADKRKKARDFSKHVKSTNKGLRRK